MYLVTKRAKIHAWICFLLDLFAFHMYGEVPEKEYVLIDTD